MNQVEGGSQACVNENYHMAEMTTSHARHRMVRPVLSPLKTLTVAEQGLKETPLTAHLPPLRRSGLRILEIRPGVIEKGLPRPDRPPTPPSEWTVTNSSGHVYALDSTSTGIFKKIFREKCDLSPPGMGKTERVVSPLPTRVSAGGTTQRKRNHPGKAQPPRPREGATTQGRRNHPVGGKGFDFLRSILHRIAMPKL